MNITPNGGDIGLTLFGPCRHSWRTRLWDRLRGREHPPTHPVHHTPLYTAFTGQSFDLPDLDADTIRVALVDSNEPIWQGPNEPPVFTWKADGTFRLVEHTHPPLPGGSGIIGCPACGLEDRNGAEG
jgi:hypothetical protein